MYLHDVGCKNWVNGAAAPEGPMTYDSILGNSVFILGDVDTEMATLWSGRVKLRQERADLGSDFKFNGAD